MVKAFRLLSSTVCGREAISVTGEGTRVSSTSAPVPSFCPPRRVTASHGGGDTGISSRNVAVTRIQFDVPVRLPAGDRQRASQS
jgi:hypothetical protein